MRHGPITERSDRIRRAHKAILSPSVSPDNFLSRAESDFDESDISFSSDGIVLVHISGSDFIDLNFIYLPGMSLNVFELPLCLTYEDLAALSCPRSPAKVRSIGCLVTLPSNCQRSGFR